MVPVKSGKLAIISRRDAAISRAGKRRNPKKERHMPNENELNGKLDGIGTEMKALLAKNSLSDNENKRFMELDAESKTIERRLVQEKRSAEIERLTERAETMGGGERRDKAELEQGFSLGAALQGHLEGKQIGAQAEFMAENRSGRKDAFAVPVSILLGGEQRALTTTTPAGGSGSNLVQTSLGR
jgi:hypothetical protein